MRASNHIIGLVNFLTLLLSIPILGGGIYLATRASTTDCLRFLQWPILALGVAIFLISLTGIAGACYRNTILMYLYLWAMFFVIAVLTGFIVFAYVVTAKGGGRVEVGKGYEDYYLGDYDGWLERRVVEGWGKVEGCVRESGVCGSKLRRVIDGVEETADMFFARKLSPVQSGCCKPPTECGFSYVNETVWDQVAAGVATTDPDCNLWSNDQSQLCYSCDSCKAGVLASIKHSWRKVSVINIVIVILLVILYIVAYAALKNNKRMDNNESYGETRMTKSQPGRYF
ncbi:Tetraspanin-3-like protein [Drosera capensis]